MTIKNFSVDSGEDRVPTLNSGTGKVERKRDKKRQTEMKLRVQFRKSVADRSEIIEPFAACKSFGQIFEN